MSDPGLGTIGLWLADLYVVSSVLLGFVLLMCSCLRQPSRRMTIARAGVFGLILLAILVALPGWPRQPLPGAGESQVRKVVSLAAGAAGPFSGVGPRMQGRREDALDTASAPESSPSQGLSPLPVDPTPRQGFTDRELVPDHEPVVRGLRLWNWVTLLKAVYTSGFVFAALWLLVGAVQAVLLCRDGHQVPERLQELLQSVLPEGARAPRLLGSGRIALPLAIGLLRPTIVLPQRFAFSEPEDRLRTALAHEYAHIRNGDLGILTLCRLLLPLFHAQPLFWLLRRQIRLDQELLADAAAASADRPRYAEILLDWARSMKIRPESTYAPALGLWERPSQLRRRIALLLDETLAIEQRSPRRWRLATWCVGILLVLGLSFASIRPVPGRAESSNPREESAAQGDSIVFEGQVLDPDGKPFSGAKIFLHYFKDTMARTPLEPRARSDATGRFRFTVEKSHFDRGATEPWKYTPLVAVAEGFGLGVSDSDDPDANRMVTIRLARDDVPIRGQLTDLEGRPVAGARIKVERVATSARDDLTPFLAAARESKTRIHELRYRYLSRDIQFTDSFHPIPTVISDREGRFVVRGIGREREVGLLVEGASTRWTEVHALARSGPAIKIVDLQRKKDPWIETYQGADFALTLAPSRPYVGFVRDRDTGRGVPGVSIESYRLADNPIENYRLVKAKTDVNGHFRLEGMPIGAGNEVVLMPPEDEPYLASHQKLRSETGLNPITVDFVLKRGVWVRGKVTNRSDGKPVRGLLRYAAAADNPLVDQAPGFRDLFFNGDYSYVRDTQPDGTYQIPVLPGRGMLALELRENDLYVVDESRDHRPDESRFVPFLYGYDQFSAEIDANEGSGVIHDFALNLGRYRSLEGQVLDASGTRLAGARYNGQDRFDSWTTEPLKASKFTINELKPQPPRTLSRLIQVRSLDTLGSFLVPEDTRPVAFVHEGKRQAGFTEVGWSTQEPVQVRLQPWGIVTGRVVDGDGQPRVKFGIRPKLILKNRVRKTRMDHFESRVLSDANGKFLVDGLIPGQPYRLVFEDADGNEADEGVDVVPVKLGETRDLGEIKTVIRGQSE